MAKQKIWLRCVNLGRDPNNADIEALFKSVEIDDLGLDNLGGYSGISHYHLDKYPVAYPSIQAFKKWHLSFYAIVDYWLKHKDLTSEQIEWINNQVLDFTLELRKTPLPEHPFDLALMQKSQMIIKFIATQFAGFLSNSENEIRQCAAEGCERYFTPNPRGREQLYCSRQCHRREYKRDYRKNTP